MLIYKSIVIVFIYVFHLDLGEGVCYFPIEYQGTFVSQTQTSIGPPGGNDPVQYQKISIEFDKIYPWGRCHEMFGSNVILWDSFHGADCMRCFHLSRKSPNVIQIHTEGLARCYTSIAAARATCPGEDRPLDLKSAQEITVYRTEGPAQSAVEPIYCPINGKYKFTYSANNGQFTCSRSVSEISNCPIGMGINVKFTECSFDDLELNFQCLGDWSGMNGKRYMALLDVRPKTHPRPKYRCAMYEEDKRTGEIFLSLSEDSTCRNNLVSATQGFELLTLKPVPSMSWPTRVETSNCYFPSWAQGEWEHMQVSNQEITFEDHIKFKTLKMRCISDYSNSTHGVFHVYSITHCGEESEICVMMAKRSPNVMEIKFGDEAITEEMIQHSIYNDKGHCWGRFNQRPWITQGRKSNFMPTACPIEGDYTGVVPGAPSLCAKVSSDCNNPEIMFYTVSSCQNKSHLYEEREYQCLGQWLEDGVVFTYTQRRDIPGYYCFTGVVKTNKDAFIKEAGKNCIRGESPDLYGMKISRQTMCNEPTVPTRPTTGPQWNVRPTYWPWNTFAPQPHQPQIPSNRPEIWQPPRPNNKLRPDYHGIRPTRQPTSRPWYPITAGPKRKNSGSGSWKKSLDYVVLCASILLCSILNNVG